MSWSTSDIPDLSAKTIVITGATSGIGLYTAKTLAHRGAKLVMLCRNVEKMADVAASINSEKSSDIVQLQCDTSDLESVRACVEAFKNTGIPRIDVLILNAGTVQFEFKTSPQGVEYTFAANHLGHWLLTGLLLDHIKDVPGSRIVLVSSLGHKLAPGIDYEVARGAKPDTYNSLAIYSATKLANQWMSESLNRRLEQTGAKTISVPSHPGISSSNITGPSPPLMYKMMKVITGAVMQTAEQGSWPLLMAATDESITKDSHYGPGRFYETYGPPIATAVKGRICNDVEKAEELWSISEDLCNFKYSI